MTGRAVTPQTLLAPEKLTALRELLTAAAGLEAEEIRALSLALQAMGPVVSAAREAARVQVQRWVESALRGEQLQHESEGG